LTAVDSYTGECLAIEVDSCLWSRQVKGEAGGASTVADNSPEFLLTGGNIHGTISCLSHEYV